MTLAVTALVAALCAFSPASHVGGGRMGVRARGAASMGLFDGLFSDPGASTDVPGGYASASHILLTGPEASEQANELKARISAGEISFSSAAAEFSACPSKGKGGSLGIFSSLGLVAFLPYQGKETGDFDAAVFSAPLNEIQTVQTSFGTHLLRVEGRGPG